MQLIKNAFIYRAILPEAQTLKEALAHMPYAPVGEAMLSRQSFVDNKDTGELVTAFTGGYSFIHRIDKKSLPASAVEVKLQERVERIEKREGRKLERDEVSAFRDQVRAEMIRGAPVVPTVTDCFYDTAAQVLIIACSSATTAKEIVVELHKLVPGFKARAVLLPGQEGHMTSKLSEYLSQGEPHGFGEFSFGNFVRLT